MKSRASWKREATFNAIAQATERIFGFLRTKLPVNTFELGLLLLTYDQFLYLHNTYNRKDNQKNIPCIFRYAKIKEYGFAPPDEGCC